MRWAAARVQEVQIALIRVPKVPSFQSRDVPAEAVYRQTDTGFYSLSISGRLRGFFAPGEPVNYALGNDDIQQDESGGATFVVWPRTLTVRQRRAVFAAARRRGWNLLQGNANSPGVYADAVWVRVNGPAKTYIGGPYPTESRSGVPCPYGPQSTLDAYPATSSLTVPSPVGLWPSLGAEWATTHAFFGSAAPQGVQCTTRGYRRGTCLRRLKRHITNTGGSYTAQD